MKLFTLLIICLLANHFMGWSLLLLSLVAVTSYCCQKIFDELIKRIVKRIVLKVGKLVMNDDAGEFCERLLKSLGREVNKE